MKLGTGTSIKRGRVKLVLWTQTSPLSKMIQLHNKDQSNLKNGVKQK
jgi:hypothetical protein